MVSKNLIFAPVWFPQMILYGREKDTHTVEERFALLRKITVHVNKAGKVNIKADGLENLPKEDGFIMFPNHQGLYDVLAFIESCSHPFTVVMKKEIQNIFFLKQVFGVMRARALDRELALKNTQATVASRKVIRIWTPCRKGPSSGMWSIRYPLFRSGAVTAPIT